MEKTEKKGKKFFNVIRIISNIIFIPIFILVLVVSIIMFSAKRNNEVPSLFGYSVVKILSSSMSKDLTTGEEQPQFAKGQFVVVKVVDTKSLNVGDVIAFYSFMDEKVDSSDLDSNKQTTSNNQESSNTNTPIVGGARNDLQKRVAPYSDVIFHRIVAISTPLDTENEFYGKLFFQTKGDANGSADTNWIMEDFVVGKYSSSNGFVCGLFEFCSSLTGSIILVIIPSLIVIAMLGLTIYNQAKDIKKDKLDEENEEELDENKVINKVVEDDAEKKEKVKAQKTQEQKEQILKDILGNANNTKESKEPKKEKEQEKVEIKKEETKPNVQSKPAENKTQSVPKPAEKKVEPKVEKVGPKTEQPKVPAKAAQKVPPKIQTTQPSAPKVPVKPTAPKVEPKTIPSAPSKVPPKAPPKKQ